jgi:hypothetical protein
MLAAVTPATSNNAPRQFPSGNSGPFLPPLPPLPLLLPPVAFFVAFEAASPADSDALPAVPVPAVPEEGDGPPLPPGGKNLPKPLGVPPLSRLLNHAFVAAEVTMLRRACFDSATAASFRGINPSAPRSITARGHLRH